MGSGTHGGQILDSDPITKIAERFAGRSLFFESHEHRHQLRHDPVEGDVVLVFDIEPVADGPSAQEDRVGSRARAFRLPGCGPIGPTSPTSAL